jgi:hypothetical protein
VAGAPLEQVRQCRRHQVHRAQPVDLSHPLGQLDVLVAERSVVGDPGVGDRQLQPAGLLDEPRDRVLHLAAVAHVGRQDVVGARELLGQLLQLLAGPRHQADGRPAPGQGTGQAAADPVRRPGHESARARPDLHPGTLFERGPPPPLP